MANRISELETHLRQWESGKQKRTAAFTLIPIAAALGVGWYVHDRVDTVERGLDQALTALEAPGEAPAVSGPAGPARLARLDGLRDELARLRELPGQLSDATAATATLQSELDAREAALAELQTRAEAGAATAAALAAERDALAGELATLASERDTLQVSVEATGAERDALQARIAEREAALAEATTALDEAGGRLAALEAERDTLARDADLASRERESYRALTAEQEQALAATTDELLAAEQRLQAVEGEARAIAEARSTLEAELTELRAAREALGRDLDLARRERESYRALVAEQEQALAGTTDALIAAERELGGLQALPATAEQLGTEVTELRAAQTTLGRDLELASRERESYRALAAEQERNLAETTDALIAAERRLVAVEQAAVAEREAAVGDLLAELAASGATIARLTDALGAAEARQASTAEALAAREAEAAAAAATLAALAEEHEQAQAAVAELRASAGMEADERLLQLEAERDAARAELAALGETVTGLESGTAALERELGLRASTIAALQTVRDDLETRLAAADDALIAGEAAETEAVLALRQELDAALRERDLAVSTAAALREVRDDLETRLAAADDALIAGEAAESEAEALRQDLEEAVRERDLAVSTAAALRDVRDDLEARLAAADDALIAGEAAESEAVQALRQDLEETVRERDLAVSTAAALRDVRDDLETRLAAADDALIAGEAAQSEAVQALRQDLEETVRERDLAVSTAAALRDVRNDLEARLAAADDALIASEAAESEAVSELRAAVGRLEAELGAAEQALDAQAATAEAALAELRDERDLAAAAAGTLEAARETLAQGLATASDRLRGSETALAERTAALAVAEAALADEAVLRAAAEAEARSRSEALAAIAAALETEQAALADLEATLADSRAVLAGEVARREAAEARIAALEAELVATAASQPLSAPTEVPPLDALLDVDQATRERLAALAAELAQLRAVTEAQRAALDRQEALSAARLDAIGAQLGASLRETPAEARAAATAAVQRDASVAGEVLARVAGPDDVALFSGRSVAYTAGLVFASGEAELAPEGLAELNRIAIELKRLTDSLPGDLPWMLRVDGHTDDLPVRRGRFRSNWELSAARASTVAQHLIDWGIPADRLIAAGFADTQPIVRDMTEEARLQNRRIELRLTVR